jgi:hypothetical protein
MNGMRRVPALRGGQSGDWLATGLVNRSISKISLRDDTSRRGIEPCRPSFFLVGAPKAGTTAMNTYLSRHPAIFMAQKELHYFSHEVFYGPPLEERDLAWYLDRFSEAGEETLLGEASVWYLSSKIAAERIKEFEPRAKILIQARNPADLIVSYHSEMLFLGYEDIEDIEQAVDAEGQRRKGWNIPARCPVPRVLYYSEVARLTAQIERFFGLFGRENVLVNIFDDLVTDPAAMYRRTLTFLGGTRYSQRHSKTSTAIKSSAAI